jgi:hypothetical protein
VRETDTDVLHAVERQIQAKQGIIELEQPAKSIYFLMKEMFIVSAISAI